MISNYDVVARDRFESLFLVVALRSVNNHGCDRPVESSIIYHPVNRIDRFIGACREEISYIFYKSSDPLVFYD